MADARLNAVIKQTSTHMNEILALFKPGAKITVMVRRPGEPRQDFMLTSDSICEIRAMLDRREAEGRNG